VLSRGGVLVDGRPRAKSFRLEGGETIELDAPAESPGLVAREMELSIAWEDEHLLVVDKPAGLVVHPGAGAADATLVQGLLAHAVAGGEPDRPGIVHRLDRDTSGLLVVARSEEAHRRLQGLIRRRRVERRYAALVRGRPRSRSGRIEAPIGRDRDDPTRQSLDTERPREAVTGFELRELLAEHAFLAVTLETGRTHQIRVHFAALRHPCVGDLTYGADPTLAARLGLTRQWLHAGELAFKHPVTGEELRFVSGYPDDLERALAILRD
jgi:23S rRNA pseudouridine1911/1915/1917 synthase